jgi:hypothetical protein
MPMDKQALVDAIRNSGGKRWALAEVDDLWPRIELLQNTGRFGSLISQLAAANDKSNFLALVLEANFAYQFESQGLQLAYEVKQEPGKPSTVDFLRQTPAGKRAYLELRLLQQRKSIKDMIDEQLQKYGIYKVLLGGDDEKREVERLQNTILAKVQDAKGAPIKFFSTDPDVLNIVVVDVSETILGTIDLYDCLLATYGDPAVDEVYRRNVFGLFQEDKPEYPLRIHNLATKYAHLRSRIHGVLFLFRQPDSGVIAYSLQQYMVWNRALVDEPTAQQVYPYLSAAIPLRQND